MHEYRTVTCRGCGQRIGLEDSYPIDDCACTYQREAQWEHIVKTCPYAHEGYCQQQEVECSADICPEVEA